MLPIFFRNHFGRALNDPTKLAQQDKLAFKYDSSLSTIEFKPNKEIFEKGKTRKGVDGVTRAV